MRARDQIKALREALKPFADAGHLWLPVDATDDSVYVKAHDMEEVRRLSPAPDGALTVGLLRKAARAYDATEPG